MASSTLLPPNSTIFLNKHFDVNKTRSCCSMNSPNLLLKHTRTCNNLFMVPPRTNRTLSISSSSLGKQAYMHSTVSTSYLFHVSSLPLLLCLCLGRGVESSCVVSEDTTNLLQRVEVFDLNGISLLISDLWKDRKAVVAFARHFGCVLCQKRAAYLAHNKVLLLPAPHAYMIFYTDQVMHTNYHFKIRSIV